MNITLLHPKKVGEIEVLTCRNKTWRHSVWMWGGGGGESQEVGECIIEHLNFYAPTYSC